MLAAFAAFAAFAALPRSVSLQDTMIMGADVTHAVAGISVAGVVASTDSNYVAPMHLCTCKMPRCQDAKTPRCCGKIAILRLFGSFGEFEASYFHEIRGQSPFTLNTLKQRKRQSEERIVDLAGSRAEGDNGRQAKVRCSVHSDVPCRAQTATLYVES